MKVLALFTCYNRKEKTLKCIDTLKSGNDGCQFTFVVADDGSTDGTSEALEKLCDPDIHVIHGCGDWFYSRGMGAAMQYALKSFAADSYDYLLLVNDDVEFLQHSIDKLIAQSKLQNDAIIVGVMQDETGNLSYGAIKYTSGYRYRKVGTDQWMDSADTFNANCVLIPYTAFLKVGVMDSTYVHSLGDFDYGLSLKRAGYMLYPSKEYAGICNTNANKNTWTDTSLSVVKRIKMKESIKGAPSNLWFYFLRKNFGLLTAIRGVISPYIRIFLKN